MSSSFIFEKLLLIIYVPFAGGYKEYNPLFCLYKHIVWNEVESECV